MRETLLTLIPARAGSKGLPRKNAKSLGGLPLLAWSYLAWREAGLPGQCWLSTEDEELAEMGRTIGIEVPFSRPPALATDDAGTIDVALHALQEFQSRKAADPDWLLILQPTSPLRPPSVLREAWARARSSPDIDAVVGVKPIYRSPSTLFYADQDAFLQPMSSEPKESRRQDVRPLVTPNGAIYFIRVRTLREERTAAPKRSVGLLMDSISSIDIDDAVDWKMAESVVAAGFAWRTER